MTAPPKRMGLVAGWGRYPLVVAEALKQQGYEVHCVGVKEHADPQLANVCDSFLLAGIGRMGAMIRFFRRQGCTEATMAGKIHKAAVLFRRWGWLAHFPDLTTLRGFLQHFIYRSKDTRDDSLLSTVVDIFARGGVHFAPATDFAPELLVKPGLLTRRGLTMAQLKDVQFGWRMAKEMGRLDIGQTVVVKDQSVLAVEAVEGTDECIRRAGQLCPRGGFTVVKVAKPQQDMRFDVPTIGQLTLETISQVHGAVLAVEADKTILLDEPAFIATANRLGLCVVSQSGESAASREVA
jgi:UDP-2,3-diacylglucosamine hydrolase